MQFMTAIVLAAFAGYAGAWYFGVVEGNFALLLFLATLVTSPLKPPVAVVSLDSDVFATLALGRRPAAAYIDAITLDGDTALGTRVVDQLNMMI